MAKNSGKHKTINGKEVQSIILSMNHAMAWQLPEPVLISYGGEQFDLSNLCIDSFDCSTSALGNSSRDCRLDDSMRSLEPSLYPGMEEMHSSLIDLEPLDIIFDRAPTRAARTGAEQRNSASSLDAFYSKSNESTPMLYTEANPLRSTPPSSIQSDLEMGTKSTAKSGFLPAPVSVESPSTAAKKYVSISESHECGMLEFGSEQLKERSRPEIEVCPGFFMLLRGADETLQAIESGFAIDAMCFCCEQSLQCVADAELVICPDCRVCSPLPDLEEDDCSQDRDDEFERSSYFQQQKVDRRRNSLRRPKIGGVGLGLKAQVN
jgi:hypothetical protein